MYFYICLYLNVLPEHHLFFFTYSFLLIPSIFYLPHLSLQTFLLSLRTSYFSLIPSHSTSFLLSYLPSLFSKFLLIFTFFFNSYTFTTFQTFLFSCQTNLQFTFILPSTKKVNTHPACNLL